jgi:hypothetical protein
MENNLDAVALDLYGKIQTKFPDIKIGDENATVLSKKADIPKARFFEFEYAEHGRPLGTITITLDIDDGIVVQVSGDIASSRSNHNAYRFIRSFRQFAKSRLLNFDVQNIGKSNMDKRDYEFRAKPKEAPIMESKMFGTSKISYQNLGEARLIIKHSQPVNENAAAGRTMHIQSIFIENSEGERFKYPYKHLHGARALAEHIKHGGNPYDSIGQYVIKLSEEMGHLRKFKGYVNRQQQLSETMGSITSRVVERVEHIKKELNNLQRAAFYEQFSESFVAAEPKQIPESVMNDWIERLTVKTFNEEMKEAFPYLYNIVDESMLPVKSIVPADLLKTETVESVVPNKKYTMQPEDMYELYLESILTEDKDELFSPNKGAQQAAINKLNDILEKELIGGPDGINAVKSLTGIIDNPAFLETMRGIDPDLDVRALIQQYVQSVDPAVSLQLHYGTGQVGGEAKPKLDTQPPAMPAPAPAEMTPPPDMGMPEPQGMPGEELPPPAPMAESKIKLRSKFIKAKTAGAKLESQFAVGMTIRDAIFEAGLTPMECGYDEPQRNNSSGTAQILKSIVGFWNKEERNFTIGGTRAKTKVIKNFKDGEYPNATSADVKQVLAMIDKMDPSEEPSEHNDIMKLAGLRQHSDDRSDNFDIIVRELSYTR